MTSRRRLLLLPVAGLVSALLWTTLGSFSSASGQEKPIVIERVSDGDHRPDLNEPIFILVLGGDARTGNPEQVRTDSVHIVALNPAEKKATIVGIPRDSYVEVPGHRRDKIAHAQYFTGNKGAVATVEGLSGCDFQYRMLTSFQGLAGNGYRTGKSEGGIINDIGGVTLDIPSPGLTDSAALGKTLDPIPPGKQRLDGPQALAWARARKDPNLRPQGDFDRSLSHGTLMVAVLAELRRDFSADPGTALRNLVAIRRYVKMNIPLGEALELGLLALEIDPDDVTNIVVDGEIGSAGGASIVQITQKGLNQLADVCTDGILNN